LEIFELQKIEGISAQITLVMSFKNRQGKSAKGRLCKQIQHNTNIQNLVDMIGMGAIQIREIDFRILTLFTPPPTHCCWGYITGLNGAKTRATELLNLIKKNYDLTDE
jgi:hypothetical protein